MDKRARGLVFLYTWYTREMKPKIKTLRNGLTIMFAQDASSVTTTVLVAVEAGSKYETKKDNGIAHFLEHLCFKGTDKRPSALAVSTELDSIGASYNAFTSHEYTGYYAKTAALHTRKAVDVVSDIYCNSLLREEDIAKEKGVIVDEINMYEDMPMSKVDDIFMDVLYGDQPAGWPIAGTKETVQSFMRKHIAAFRKKHYVPQATTVVVVGNFDERDVLKQLEKNFGALASGKKGTKKKTLEKQQTPALAVVQKKSDQTHIIVGVRSFPAQHPSRYPLLVLSSILGGGMSSRLFQKIRVELGVGYYVRASQSFFSDHGYFSAALGVDNTRAVEALNAVLDEFARIRTELVSEEELTRVKEMLYGRLHIAYETSDDIAGDIAMQHISTKTYVSPEEHIKKIAKVTAKDIQDIAQKIFIDKHLNLAVIGPWKNDKEFRKVLKVEDRGR